MAAGVVDFVAFIGPRSFQLMSGPCFVATMAHSRGHLVPHSGHGVGDAAQEFVLSVISFPIPMLGMKRAAQRALDIVKCAGYSVLEGRAPRCLLLILWGVGWSLRLFL